ncbi:MAG: hypothetical protein L0Z50_05950, partial [Verrucomicrobiales bacterium]|nr:hypothetical protein [Verrucomicrobiales bacterium]
HIPEKPLDVLAQQIVAAASCEDWEEDKLFELMRQAWPYRNLTRKEFDDVVQMLASGFSTKRGRRGALLHHDAVNRRLRGRRGSRLLALTSGGAIPDNADYRVVLEPPETFIGTVNEDFAIESLPGDIFQLGNASWKILRINSGQVRVEDARGQPPSIPFWLGEAPGRTDELSRAVSELREEIESIVSRDASEEVLAGWLVQETGIPDRGARQLAAYFVSAFNTLGVIPSQRTLVMERFFDESGGMQLVIHSPFGTRLNRAWGLALRKRFCRSFNFELQAAATDDAIVLSLGTQHSFPLEEVFRYLNSQTARGVLVQALLDAPMFTIRWRWNASRALAVPRQRGGRKLAAPLQRMESENLLAAVFPDQLACLENIPGDREVPDHPLVNQTIDDCLSEAMDIAGLEDLLRAIEQGQVRCLARDLPEPSPLAHEILSARPSAFLDDAPLEERRTQAVYTRRTLQSSSDNALGILDSAAIEQVTAEACPAPRSEDELHEALLLLGVMTEEEILKANLERDGVGSPLTPALSPLRGEGVAANALKTSDFAIGVPAAPVEGGMNATKGTEPSPSLLNGERAGVRGGIETKGHLNQLGNTSPDHGQRAESEQQTLGPLVPPGHHRSDTRTWMQRLIESKRAGRLIGLARDFWVAAERIPMIQCVYPASRVEPPLSAPESAANQPWEREQALRELVRGRMEFSGPVTAGHLAELLCLSLSEVDQALLALEAEGFVLRGRFRPEATKRLIAPTLAPVEEEREKPELEWCERRLLARIHRLTINRLRAEIQPVTIQDFLRFLLEWQRLTPEHRAQGPDGLMAVIEQLDAFEAPVAAWEPDLFLARVAEYDPAWLDRASFSGHIGWARLSARDKQKARPFSPLRTSPVAFFDRDNLSEWMQLCPLPVSTHCESTPHPGGHIVAEAVAADVRRRKLTMQIESASSRRRLRAQGGEDSHPPVENEVGGDFPLDESGAARVLSHETQKVLALLQSGGALFFADLVRKSQLFPSQVEQGLAELIGLGLVTSDSFDGVRALLVPSDQRPTFGRNEGKRRQKKNLASIEFAGRWWLLPRAEPSNPKSKSSISNASAVEKFAWTLLRRYGVVFRRMLDREAVPVSWYELGKAYRSLEARGLIRGGHFISGVGGEQFALAEAIGRLRAIRKTAGRGELIAVSGADPLNLLGILVPGPRLPALASNRVLFRDGLPVAILEAGQIRHLHDIPELASSAIESALTIRTLPPALRPYY